MTRHAPYRSLFVIVFGATLLLNASSASAQRAPQKATTPPQQAASEPPAATPEPAPAVAEKPGLLNEIGKLFVKPADLFPSLKPSDAAAPVATPAPLGDADVATPPAIAAPVAPVAPSAAPPSTTATAPAKTQANLVPQVIRGRAVCPVSSNGAPDCKAGADKLCQDKGFASGSSLDMDSAKTCSTKALLQGARHIRDICKTENYVTRAMCQ